MLDVPRVETDPLAMPLSLFTKAALTLFTLIAAGLCSALAQETIKLKPGDSLQEAIDKAAPGSVIELEEGTYPERLLIMKPLTIRGTGDKPSVIRPATLAPASRVDTVEDYQNKIKGLRDKHDRLKAEILFRHEINPPVILIASADGLKFENLRISTPPAESDHISQQGLIEALNSDIQIHQCEIVGPWANGIFIGGTSGLKMTDSLVSAFWGSGIAIAGSAGEKPKDFLISNFVIRNCHHRGIVFGKDVKITIDGCRISGSAWHGIRYDDASPTITNNIIFGNAKSGIYAAGQTQATVTGNVFWKNQQNGMSCWYNNKDNITNNTFAGNGNEGLAILGACAPVVKSNIFADNPVGIVNALVNSKRVGATTLGNPEISGNLFWQNKQLITKPSETPGGLRQEVPMDDNAVKNVDPGFSNAETGDFTLTKESGARAKEVGAAETLKPTGGWEIQGEELLMIPNGPDWNTDFWKRPATQADAETLAAMRDAAQRWSNGIKRLKDPSRREAEIQQMRAYLDKLEKTTPETK